MKTSFGILFCFLTLLTTKTQALVLDLNLYYETKSLKVSSTETYGKTFIEGAILLDIVKKPRLVLGWSYGLYSTTDTTTSTTTIAATDMGPRFGWFIDKGEEWSLFLTYGLVGNATYSPGGGTSEKWRGTSLKADIGWGPKVGEHMSLGIRLNYYAATYTESLTNDTTFAQVSYTQSFIYPSIFVSYQP